MTIVTVSTRYRVTIPRAIPEALGIRPGQVLQMVVGAGCVQIIPLCPVCKLRGYLKGIDTSVAREGDRVWWWGLTLQ